MNSQHLPGMTVAISKNGTILYAQGYGYADLSVCTPMPSNAEMNIGSITKQFTAVAILQLQNAGKLDIDQPLITYLPGYAFDARITLRMLLNQTSGLQDYLNFPELKQYATTGAPASVGLNAIVQRTLDFTPGTQFEYSNSNYFILGSVIEAVSGSTYPDYLTAHVYAPAGLADTFYTRPAQSAAPYMPGSAGPVPGTVPDSSAYFAAGALWSNVQDLASWDAALLGGREIPPAQVTLMMTPVPVPLFGSTGAAYYGMGLIQTGPVAGHPFVWHNGQSLSYTGFNGMFTDDGFAVTVLTNYPTAEGTPLLNFTTALINAICTSPGTAGNC